MSGNLVGINILIMERKSIYLLLITCFLTMGSFCKASPYNPIQEKFINDIYIFLNTNGYNVSYNSESGEINLVSNQLTYKISLDESSNNPFFISIYIDFNMTSLDSSEYSRLFALLNYTNSSSEFTKAFLMVNDDMRILDFTIEGLYLDSNNYKAAIVKYIQSIEGSVNTFFKMFNDKSIQ